MNEMGILLTNLATTAPNEIMQLAPGVVALVAKQPYHEGNYVCSVAFDTTLWRVAGQENASRDVLNVITLTVHYVNSQPGWGPQNPHSLVGQLQLLLRSLTNEKFFDVPKQTRIVDVTWTATE